MILRNWELWADGLRDDLISCPSLIYNRSPTESRAWLASLNIVLDASAALIVASDAAIECQGKRIFAACRSLAEIAEYLRSAAPDSKLPPDLKASPANYQDEILSAETICEAADGGAARKEIELPAVRQMTYQPLLWMLSVHLAAELPSRNGKTRRLSSSYKRLAQYLRKRASASWSSAQHSGHTRVEIFYANAKARP